MVAATNAQRFEAIVAELKALAAGLRRARIALYHRAHEIEVNERAEWLQYHPTFDDLFERYNLGDIVEYRNFLAAEKLLQGIEAKVTKGIKRPLQNIVFIAGPAAIAEVAKAANEGAAEEKLIDYLEAAVTRAEVTGLPWEKQHAADERRKIVGNKGKKGKWNKRANQQRELLSEAGKLRKLAQDLYKALPKKEREQFTERMTELRLL